MVIQMAAKKKASPAKKAVPKKAVKKAMPKKMKGSGGY